MVEVRLICEWFVDFVGGQVIVEAITGIIGSGQSHSGGEAGCEARQSHDQPFAGMRSEDVFGVRVRGPVGSRAFGFAVRVVLAA